MTRQPSISVVMPCYNAAKYLRETLDSVMAQTYAPLEVLVVDDGSTDDSAAIAESYGPPVRVIRQPNQGESTARNRGLDEARGDWVAFIDADDLWMPTKLERQIAALGDADDVVCVHTNVFLFGAATGYLPFPPENLRYTVPQVMFSGSPIQLSSAMVRRDVPVRFPVWSKYGEDINYFLDLLRLGRQILVPEDLAGYRKHDSSLSTHPNFILLWLNSGRRWLDEHGSTLSKDELRAARAALRRKTADARLANARRLRNEGQLSASTAEFLRAIAGGHLREGLLGFGRLMLYAIRRPFGGRAPKSWAETN